MHVSYISSRIRTRERMHSFQTLPEQATLIVSVESNCTILSCIGTDRLLGYQPEEIIGESLRVLCGELTDTELLESCIKVSAYNTIRSVLYNVFRQPRAVQIHSLPWRSPLGVKNTCLQVDFAYDHSTRISAQVNSCMKDIVANFDSGLSQKAQGTVDYPDSISAPFDKGHCCGSQATALLPPIVSPSDIVRVASASSASNCMATELCSLRDSSFFISSPIGTAPPRPHTAILGSPSSFAVDGCRPCPAHAMMCEAAMQSPGASVPSADAAVVRAALCLLAHDARHRAPLPPFAAEFASRALGAGMADYLAQTGRSGPAARLLVPAVAAGPFAANAPAAEAAAGAFPIAPRDLLTRCPPSVSGGPADWRLFHAAAEAAAAAEEAAAPPAVRVDEAYVRRVRRRHAAADHRRARRAACEEVPNAKRRRGGGGGGG